VFAIIGFLTAHRLPATIPSCTGARHASILGAVVPGCSSLRLQQGAESPTSLTVRTPLRP
jgi:anhydro-N-acetylmuramic acid kinase